jgi:hypothetical protein
MVIKFFFEIHVYLSYLKNTKMNNLFFIAYISFILSVYDMIKKIFR